MKVLALLLALAGLAPVAASAYTIAGPAYQNFSVTRTEAARIAQHAVGGGQVLQVQYDDSPRPMWQVEIMKSNGAQYEVNVSVRTGRVLAIIYQGNDG